MTTPTIPTLPPAPATDRPTEAVEPEDITWLIDQGLGAKLLRHTGTGLLGHHYPWAEAPGSEYTTAVTYERARRILVWLVQTVPGISSERRSSAIAAIVNDEGDRP